jgi:hypothetical protein
MYSVIWAYPWDFLDEGADSALGRIADAGLNGMSVAAAYHSVRALCPHNPNRAVVHGEGGVVYFKPEPSFFKGKRLRPVESALLADNEQAVSPRANGDPLSIVCEAAARRGLKVHAWTVLHHNTRLGTAFPDCTIENAFGDRYPFGLCPANPDVRAYTLGLIRSLAQREDLDTIELESLGYMGMDHTGHHSKGTALAPLQRFLLSICFCAHCAGYMTAQDVDVAQARQDVRENLLAYFSGSREGGGDTPEELAKALGAERAAGILAAREEAVFSLLAEIRQVVRAPQKLSVMITPSRLATGAQVSGGVARAAKRTDRLLHQAFSTDAAPIRKAVAEVAAQADGTPVFAGLQAIAPFVRSSEEMVERVRAARSGGAEGAQFYHYGLMPLENLEWIRRALVKL